MDSERIIAELRKEFPGKNIVRIPEEDPKELIVELGPVSEKESIAVAIIDRGPRHLHRVTTETYVVQTGMLRVHVDDRVVELWPGQRLRIDPGQVHWSEGHATRLLVYAEPAWQAEDYIPV
jgi:mannose-6-phosphate isomerase-like protein (cupin superfamily)